MSMIDLAKAFRDRFIWGGQAISKLGMAVALKLSNNPGVNIESVDKVPVKYREKSLEESNVLPPWPVSPIKRREETYEDWCPTRFESPVDHSMIPSSRLKKRKKKMPDEDFLVAETW